MAGAAVVTGLRPVMDADALLRAAGQDRPDRLEAVRRLAIGALFGIHTLRFRIYLQPDSGRKNGVSEETFLSGLAPMARGE